MAKRPAKPQPPKYGYGRGIGKNSIDTGADTNLRFVAHSFVAADYRRLVAKYDDGAEAMFNAPVQGGAVSDKPVSAIGEAFAAAEWKKRVTGGYVTKIHVAGTPKRGKNARFKSNVCKRCFTAKSANGTCLCG